MSVVSTREELKAKLAELGIAIVSEEKHDAVMTCEAQIEVVKNKDSVAKNVLFIDKKKALWLCVVAHDRTIDTKALRKKLGAKGGLRFYGDSKEIMGCEKGSLTPLAIQHDEKKQVVVLLDSAFEKKNISVHPCGEKGNTATWTIAAAGLVKYVESCGSKVELIDFDNLIDPKEEKKAKATKAKKGKKGGKKGGGKKEKKVNRDGIEVKKSENPFLWYTQCIYRSGMLERYDVSGCYVLRPWSFSIWEAITRYFDTRIKKLGVQNCYFPLFVPERNLTKEKDHVEGFAPEVAWVTKSGESELKEPIAIRPTSETVMYPYYSQWIRSHRDLPLKLNQWCNVVRWEFSYPTPFIRTREFLWQEGHSAFATQREAEEEVLTILGLYKNVYEDLLAVPVIKGKKTEKEKFAGGLYTTTVEAFIPTSGRGIQGATSHCLGQNFAKMFQIKFEDKDTVKRHVWQNSWGLTTRTIGVMVLVHGDDKGLVLPPRVAPIQVVIVPIIYTKTREAVLSKGEDLEKALDSAGVRVKLDSSENHNPGWKFNYYELKGVPIRIELGPKDLEKKTVVLVRRDNGQKIVCSWEDLASTVGKTLLQIHTDMFNRAKKVRDSRLRKVTNWGDFMKALNDKCMVMAPWCGDRKAEELIKEKTGAGGNEVIDLGEDATDEVCTMSGAAKTLCIPFKQDPMPPGTKCIGFPERDAKMWVLFGRSY
ncbi:hypothetical protein AAMO2058_000524800 [Amorphochlora amoebiformis]|mmetsp:Transcript_13874/g.21944  ORF Transcript_13874/g.21944 Transcript_13874/m.21944 type:complete len:705 (-) Transcript_13874:168-2282(-)